MIITDKNQRFRVTLRNPDVVLTTEPRTDMATFMAWWKEQAGHHNLTFHPVSQDYGIAKRLLSKRGLDRLTAVSVMFWRRHADPLVEGEYGQHMVLLASRYDQAARDYDASE